MNALRIEQLLTDTEEQYFLENGDCIYAITDDDYEDIANQLELLFNDFVELKVSEAVAKERKRCLSIVDESEHLDEAKAQIRNIE